MIESHAGQRSLRGSIPIRRKTVWFATKAGTGSFEVTLLNHVANFEALIITAIKNPKDGYKLHYIIVMRAGQFLVAKSRIALTLSVRPSGRVCGKYNP
jgi:hypothetical protein